MLDFGAIPDGVMRTDGAMVDGSPVLSSPGGSFTSTDIGKYIQVVGAGPGATKLSDGSINAHSTTLSSPTGAFVTQDVGRDIVVGGAGRNGVDLVAKIQAYSSRSSVIISIPAETTVTSQKVYYGAMTLEASIVSVSSPTAAILNSPALATINTAPFSYGTDNHLNFQSALDAVGSAGGGTVLVPAASSCPDGAVCGYVVRASDQQTAKAPGAIKIRYSNVSLVGDAPQTNLFCRGAFGTYSNSAAFSGTTGNIRGFCLALGDNGGANGAAGTSVSNVSVEKLHLYGMTNGNTFNNNFAYPPSPTTTDGWDVTHKALYMWDGGNFSNITLDSIIIQDFKAENIYSGGSAVTGMVIKNSTITNFNGNGISMLAADLQVLNNTISNGSNAAVENSTVSTGKAALIRQSYQGNTIANIPREGIVVVGVDGGIASGRVDITGNRFDTIAQVNPSGTQSAIYVASQNNFLPPANVTVSGNTCHDCYSFGVFQTGKNSTVSANTFIVDHYNAGNFISFAYPTSYVSILNNTGYSTPNAQANGLSIGAVYDVNPGYQTGSFVWSNVLVKGNSWTFPGAPQYRFVTSSGLGWALVGGRNINWQGDVCNGCTHANSDHGLVDLSRTRVIEPFGPSVYVNGNTSAQLATIDASLEEDGAQVQIVNAGSSPVSFSSDQNLSLSPGLSLAAGQSATFVYSQAVGKLLISGGQTQSSASLAVNGGTPQSAAINSAFATNLTSIVKDGSGNPLAGVSVLYTVNGTGASATFGGSSQANTFTSSNGIATAPTLTANGQNGSFSVVSTAVGATGTATFQLSNVAVNKAPNAAGLLTGTVDSGNATADLTAEGKVDWLHWGDQVQVRKAGIAPELGNLGTVGSGTVFSYNNDPRPITWSDGSPLASVQNNVSGVYISRVGQGFSITAPADQTYRVLTLHVGGYVSGGRLTAHLSDGSSADYTDATPLVNGQYDRNYKLSYRAGTSAQVLTVTWVMTLGPSLGNVTINAAALSGSELSATGGTPQSTEVNQAFAIPLSATLKNSGGAPVAGADVTFTAVGSNASATFSGSASVTVSTRADGVALAPTLTANSKPGAFQVVAVASGAGSQANFSLTNTSSAQPGNIAICGGSNQQAAVNSPFGSALQVGVVDSHGTGIGGVQVTFSAPLSGAGAKFNGATSITVNTANDGTATSPIPVANSVSGSYTITASVTGFTTPLLFSLANISGAGQPGGGVSMAGVLTGSVSSATSSNLTMGGTTDWVHWGDSNLNRKANVTQLIGNVHVVGAGSSAVYSNDPRALSWTNGSPTSASSNDTNGLYTRSTSDGFSFSVPASNTTQRLTVLVGGWLSSGKLVAHLSDGSAADYIDQTSLVNGQYDRTYTLIFNAKSAGQTLQITWMNTAGGGNVTISGAALQ